ncbi:hypothetical protein AX15_002234 [Amanita polypyramis BW_CC]|nr:hypothetical protein AX15_002234 [Amanita polypyramis BW_CC]
MSGRAPPTRTYSTKLPLHVRNSIVDLQSADLTELDPTIGRDEGRIRHLEIHGEPPKSRGICYQPSRPGVVLSRGTVPEPKRQLSRDKERPQDEDEPHLAILRNRVASGL